MRIFRFNKSGFTLLGVVIALLILAAMGTVMTRLVATNQFTRIQQVQSNQAFYSSHAGFEFVLREILANSSTETSFTRHFLGEPITVTRSNGIVNVTGVKGEGQAMYRMADPNPPVGGNCLDVDATNAEDGMSGGVPNREIQGIVLRRRVGCIDPILIQSITVSWVPVGSSLLQRITIDGNRIYNTSGLPSGSNFDITDVTIADNNPHPINSFRWRVPDDMRNHNFIFTFHLGDGSQTVKNINFLSDNQSDCLFATITGAYLEKEGPLYRDVKGVAIRNDCDSAIRIQSMRISWVPAVPARMLEQVQLNNVTLFNGSATSGSLLSVDHTIPANTTQTLDLLRFDNEMFQYNPTLVWEMIDGTTATTYIPIFPNNQSLCLRVNATLGSVGGVGNKNILGFKIENTGCGLDIAITGMTVSWTGNPGLQMQQIRIDGNTVFNGNLSSGQLADFGNEDIYFRNEMGPKDINHIRFNNGVANNTQFTFVFHLSDGTNKTSIWSNSVITQADSLVIDVSGVSVGGTGNTYIYGITLSNSGTSTITIDRMTTSWTPTNRFRRHVWTQIGEVYVYTGNNNTGVNVNITDVVLNAGQTKPINSLRFSGGSMVGYTLTLTFQMLGGSTKTTTVNL